MPPGAAGAAACSQHPASGVGARRSFTRPARRGGLDCTSRRRPARSTADGVAVERALRRHHAGPTGSSAPRSLPPDAAGSRCWPRRGMPIPAPYMATRSLGDRRGGAGALPGRPMNAASSHRRASTSAWPGHQVSAGLKRLAGGDFDIMPGRAIAETGYSGPHSWAFAKHRWRKPLLHLVGDRQCSVRSPTPSATVVLRVCEPALLSSIGATMRGSVSRSSASSLGGDVDHGQRSGAGGGADDHRRRPRRSACGRS